MQLNDYNYINYEDQLIISLGITWVYEHQYFKILVMTSSNRFCEYFEKYLSRTMSFVQDGALTSG